MMRRDFLQASACAGLAMGAGEALAETAAPLPASVKRISCEEGFTTNDVVAAARKLSGGRQSPSTGLIGGPLLPLALDIGAGRSAAMDRDHVDIQVLALSSPGVQPFDPATAIALARGVNDELAAAIKAHPTRFAGLAAVAPQAPAESAKELERAVRTLGLNGAIINSHTQGEYLDDQKFWPLLEAAAALDVPIYLHPREPSPGMAAAVTMPGFLIGWGFGVEAGTHALRLIGSGVFDRYPKLRIVLGHMGETIPFVLERIDNRYRFEEKLFPEWHGREQLPGEYFRDHFVVTTSGMNYEAPLVETLATLGPDRVLFAADYPFESQELAIKAMDGMPIAADVKAKIYEGNPRRVFGIAAA
jgi:5-carboxyvanillate decarboxylase